MLTVDLARLGLEPGDWLLDAGCGGGRHCFGALDRGVHTVGLDLDVPSLCIARAGIHERRGRARPDDAPARWPEKLHGGVLRGDVFRLPFPDAAFDRVICSEVMEHVHDYGAAARELARVVRPEGTVAVTIPTAITEWGYLFATRRYFESPGGHIRVFRPRDLALALARAGLRVDGVGFAHAFHSPYWGVRALVGLDDEQAPPTRAFRAFLVKAAFSRTWSRVERLFDWVWPKSLVLYGTRVATGRRPEP